jgi:hypothetical protein
LGAGFRVFANHDLRNWWAGKPRLPKETEMHKITDIQDAKAAG